MLHKNINFKIVGLALVATVVGGLFSGDNASAICADDGVSCVAIKFGQPVGERTVNPSSNIYSATQFYLPITIDIEHDVGYAIDYAIKVYGSGNTLANTIDSNTFIPSVPQNTSYNDLGKNGSEWGIRWNFGDTVGDAHSDYHPVPSSIDDLSAVVIADGKVNKGTGNLTKQLTLGFAVAVDGNQASGSYTNTVTVAVVASPKDVRDLFDIYYMQDMTADICDNTTTPNAGTISTSSNINVTGTGMGASAAGSSYTTAIDTNGTHRDDARFVPQAELVDKRDGKKYTVRKLADGNCWMVSNLEFDFVPTANKISGQTPTQSAFSATGEDKLTGSQLILTNKDTDLNSMREWTPAISAEKYGEAGTVYKTQRIAGKGSSNDDAVTATSAKVWASDGSDGLRSFSNAAAFPSALYSTKTAATPAFGSASTGSPWQRFGNLYNWTTVTLGSGTEITDAEQDAVDSICPRGWKVPSGLGDDSFPNLFEAYGLSAANETTTTNANVGISANRLANFPLNFLRSGYYQYSDGKIVGRISNITCWTATSLSATHARDTYMFTDRIYPRGSDSRGFGSAVRCVARK